MTSSGNGLVPCPHSFSSCDASFSHLFGSSCAPWSRGSSGCVSFSAACLLGSAFLFPVSFPFFFRKYDFFFHSMVCGR